MRTFIYMYNDFSKGGRAIRDGLGLKHIRRNKAMTAKTAEQLPSSRIINWGAGVFHDRPVGAMVNPPSKVVTCSDKLRFFQAVDGVVRIPEFTSELGQALVWGEEGKEVLGRSRRGSCGADITFYSEDLENFVKSEFFVVYKKKKAEYRVHIAFGNVIAVQQKVLRTTDPEGNPIPVDNVDFRIRNLSHGFIFKRFDLSVPADVLAQAQAAIQTVGLDFGAVDVIFNQMEEKGYVLEINTAPGLEGSTIDDYISAFKNNLDLNEADNA